MEQLFTKEQIAKMSRQELFTAMTEGQESILAHQHVINDLLISLEFIMDGLKRTIKENR
jgi:hypothetical protein